MRKFKVTSTQPMKKGRRDGESRYDNRRNPDYSKYRFALRFKVDDKDYESRQKENRN
ncbi:MAG: hypothetical protein ACRD8U_22560 [Pyrinomonadaceae bacterium]